MLYLSLRICYVGLLLAPADDFHPVYIFFELSRKCSSGLKLLWAVNHTLSMLESN